VDKFLLTKYGFLIHLKVEAFLYYYIKDITYFVNMDFDMKEKIVLFDLYLLNLVLTVPLLIIKYLMN
jgi:hypothetical protein